jgi:hypothetical protein
MSLIFVCVSGGPAGNLIHKHTRKKASHLWRGVQA